MLCFCSEHNGGVDLHDNFWTAIAFAAFITWILKMCAIFLEQVVIGMNLGKYVVVRKFVQINSTEMRAIRAILDVPGIQWKKCVILLGGPDWPTSVLTGIMRLSVIQCLIGSSPFLILNTPTVLGGALQLRRAESDMWGTMANVGFLMAAATQGSATSLCGYYVFDTAEARREEFAAMEDDQEVKEAEEKAALKDQYYKAATDWRTRMPQNIKAVLVLGALLNGIFLFLGAIHRRWLLLLLLVLVLVLVPVCSGSGSGSGRLCLCPSLTRGRPAARRPADVEGSLRPRGRR